MMILVAHSWWIHYKVKDGIARIMLLWGCGFLFAFLAFRTLGYLLFDFGILNMVTHKTLNMYNVWFIYALVVGQYVIQNRRER
jgi:formate/nitrite transporter FocA (FNT family)